MTARLRFGVFLAPFHKPGINPTLALQNDLDLVAWLDRLGYDEAGLVSTIPPVRRSARRPKS